MKILLLELKKIWTVKILLLIAAVCILFYFMFMEFYIKYYPNSGRFGQITADMYIELTEKYGVTLEPDEYADFLKTRDAFIAEAERYMGENPVFAAAGILTFDDYCRVHSLYYEKFYTDSWDEVSGQEREAVEMLENGGADWILEKINTAEQIALSYSLAEPNLKNAIEAPRYKTEERYKSRYIEILSTGEYMNIMDRSAFEYTMNYFVRFAILAVLSTFILVSPLVASDRRIKLNMLQYSTNQGRRLLRKQFVAIALSAFLLTTILLSVLGAIYARLGIQFYWNSGATSFGGWTLRIPMTFGSYVVLMTALSYTLSVGASMLAFVLSRFSRSMPEVLLKVVPMFVILAFLSSFVYKNLLIANDLPYASIWPEFSICVFVFLSGLTAASIVTHREKRIDVQ